MRRSDAGNPDQSRTGASTDTESLKKPANVSCVCAASTVDCDKTTWEADPGVGLTVMLRSGCSPRGVLSPTVLRQS
jgi:hypothetical protein